MNLSLIKQKVVQTAERFGRNPADIHLLAVSKSRRPEEIRALYNVGQRDFGESYSQEALPKIQALKPLPELIWHFIGPVQSNKTADIAAHFAWVHSLSRLKIAQRLNDQRPTHLPPLNVCVQVNIDAETTKSGVSPESLLDLCNKLSQLPRLKLRGLMALPTPHAHFEQQRAAFCSVRECYTQLQQQGYRLDSLSMGTSQDMIAAIAEGATWLRIGTALFGPRL